MKSYRDNGGGEFGARHKTVYDDVFGGPPKFGAPTLPPRLEDYTEIFQGFHASRGSSIPVLDLPPASEGSDDIWFDLQTSKLDYSEVFGGFNSLDFAVSYENLFKNSEVVEDDSSDEAWTPAQSESLSDESDPYASLEKNQHLSNADPDHSFVTTKEFKLSLNEVNSNAKKDISNGMTNGSQFHELPGSTVLEDQAPPNKIENEEVPSKGNMYHSVSKDIGGVAEGKRLKKALSQPANSRPLFSVSDISLKTQPSPLPPPSRPPPALAKKKGDTGSFNLKLKNSKSYAFERMAGDSSPPYFDVEIDASSSAAASAAAMKDVMEHAHAKLRSAKELMERKKEGLLSRSKLRMENDVKDNEGREEIPKVKMGEKNITQIGNFIERETVKELKLYKGLRETKGTVESREETQFHELIITKQVKDVGMLEPDIKSRVFRENKSLPETFEQQDDVKNERKEEDCGLAENKVKRETLKKSHGEEEHLKKSSEGQKACEPREREKTSIVGQRHGEIKTVSEDDEIEFYENLIEIHIKDKNMETVEKLTGVHEKVDAVHQLENDGASKGYYMGSEKYDVGLQEAIEQENENIQEETLEQDLKKAQQMGPNKIETIKSKEEKGHGMGESERIVEDVLQYIKENEERYVKAAEQEESDKISETVLEQDTDKKKQILEQNEKIFQDELTPEKEHENVNKRENVCEREENELTLNHPWEKEEIGKRHKIDSNSEEDRKSHEGYEEEENEKWEEVVIRKDGIQNEPEATKWEDDDKSLHSNSESHSSIEEENHSETSDGAYQADDDEILQASGENIEATPLKNRQPRSHTYDELAEESFCSFALNPNGLLNGKAEVRMADVTNSNPSNGSAGRTYCINVVGETEMGNDNRTSENLTPNHGGKRMNVKGVQSGIDLEGRMNIYTPPQVAREWVEAGGKTNNTAPNVAGRAMEKKDEFRNKILAEDREKEEKLQRERELESDRLRKIEERERQREREKDRMAVDTATLEARERAFAEARERAERAAVERATAEFRQRALAEARERLEKACAEARERSLAEKMSEARLRVERAAVEKASAEARERAEKSAADKFSTSRNSGTRQNSSSSDLPDSQYLNVGSYSGLRYSYTAAHSAGEGESPQRCKARLERHQRTADRAAKALAEKNMRDLIAQKEQAERNRLAEGLDAEVKRWSSGKQGNLRALLSTLQYILGPESGWHPVPLTEVITTAAVKKAYRKATLCVHPDKLQQRGATIQQKYICEKVFDLLKEAWNKFNSEER